MRISLILVFLCIMISPLNAQPDPGFKNSEYEKGRIVLVEYQSINASKIRISEDSIFYYNVDKKLDGCNNLKEVYYIRVVEGTQALKWSLLGLALTAAVTINEIITVNTNPNYVFKENAVPIYIGLNMAGLCIGGLIGSFIPNKRTYYPEYMSLRESKINWNVYLTEYSRGITVRLDF